MLDQLLQLAFNGLVSGTIIAIGAVGASLVWGVLRIGNFAHGDYMAVGAYAAYAANVVFGLPIPLAALVAIVATGIFAVLADRVFLRPMRFKGLTSVFIVTVGLGFVIRNVLFMASGTAARSYDLDQTAVITLGPVRASPGQLVTVVVAALAILLVGWLLKSTSIGRSMRALSENPDLAATAGINVDRVTTATWLLSGGLAGLGGMCLGLVQGSFNPNMGAYILFLVFTAVVLGGIGSAFGALAGGLALGVAMEVSTWQGFAGGVDPRYKLVLAFGVLIVLLVVRPQGLFGKARLL